MVGRFFSPQWLTRLLISMALFSAATNIVRPMLTWRALALGGDESIVGYIAAAGAVPQLLAAVPLGRWVDRRGAERFVFVGMAAETVVTGLLVVSTEVWQLPVLNAVLGLGQISQIVGAQGLLAAGSKEGDYDRRFGLFGVYVSIGQLVGPVIGGYLAHASGEVNNVPRTAWSLLAATGMLAVGVLLVGRMPGLPARQPQRTAQPAMSATVVDITRKHGMPQMILASLSVMVCMELIAVYLPLLGHQQGIGARDVGLLLALRAAASILSRLIILPLLRAVGRRRLLAGSMVLSAVATAAVPFIGNVFAIGALMIVLGFFLGLGQPITMSWVVMIVAPHVRATALALRLTGNRVGQTVVPALAGVVAGPAGVAGVFLLLGALLGAATCAVIPVRERRVPP